MSEPQIFKFCADPACLEDVLAGRLKFARPSELNDPSELAPRFSVEEVTRSLQDLKQRGHSQTEVEGLRRQAALMRALAPHLQILPAPNDAQEADAYLRLPVFENTTLIQTAFALFVEELSSNVGVCCFTERSTSLPMWSHYADRARGFCVAYHSLADEFPGDDTGLLNRLRQVEYARENSSVTFYPESYSGIFFSKFKDWSYETEWRIVSRLADCKKIENQGEQHYFREIGKSRVASVILGWMMPDDVKRNLQATFRANAAETTRLMEARFEGGDVRFDELV